MQKISTVFLQKKLMGKNGAFFATIVTETEPVLKKTGNPYFGNIIKRSKANVTFNFKYENSVNNARVKEGNTEYFTPKPRKWGEKIPNTCFVLHNNTLYAEVKFNNSPSEVIYKLKTGEIIDIELLKPFITERNSNAEHQGLSEEKEIILRDIKISNIKEIIMDKEHYMIS